MTTLCIAACSVTRMFICTFLVFVFVYNFHLKIGDVIIEIFFKQRILQNLRVLCHSFVGILFDVFSDPHLKNGLKLEPDTLSDRDQSFLKLFKAKCWQHFKRWLISFHLKKNNLKYKKLIIFELHTPSATSFIFNLGDSSSLFIENMQSMLLVHMELNLKNLCFFNSISVKITCNGARNIEIRNWKQK